jgi:hypothetical protein
VLQESEHSELLQELYIHECVWKASIRSKYADNMLQHLLQEEEFINFDKVWEVIDHFRAAIILSREQDVEQEAYSTAKMGVVFDKIVKHADKAYELYKISLQLVISLQPKQFDSIKWYQELKERIQHFRDVNYEADLKKKEINADVYLQELETELQEMKEAAQKSWQSLLRHLYQKHPPKHFPEYSAPAEPFDDASASKVILGAIRHYHPDKIDEKVHGMKWKVHCEEAVKYLNDAYGLFKPV